MTYVGDYINARIKFNKKHQEYCIQLYESLCKHLICLRLHGA